MSIFLKYKWYVLGGIAGLIIGYAHWYYIGCSSGTCPLTSNPVNSSLYGLFFGIMVVSLFADNSKTSDNQTSPKP
jgi:hypothetical protein